MRCDSGHAVRRTGESVVAGPAGGVTLCLPFAPLRFGVPAGGTRGGEWRRDFQHAQHGFTLMELVVVLSIIGMLVALALPRYIIPRRNAYKAEALNLLQEVKTMEWGYYQQYN